MKKKTLFLMSFFAATLVTVAVAQNPQPTETPKAKTENNAPASKMKQNEPACEKAKGEACQKAATGEKAAPVAAPTQKPAKE